MPGDRAKAVAVLAVVTAALVSACDLPPSPDADVMGICADASGNRVDDSQCGSDWDDDGNALNALPGNYFIWIDTGAHSGRVPAVGQRVAIGQRSIPPGKFAAQGVPAAGGDVAAIKRGGFGTGAGKAGSSSGS